MTTLRVPFLLAGLPDAGKSTYLAALFHTLKVGANPTFKLETLPDEREYLIDLETRWLALTPVGHSSHPIPQRIDLPIATEGWGSVSLAIPDVTGEEFQDAWETGHWSADVAELAKNATGILFFVRADDVSTPELVEVGKQAGEVAEQGKAAQWEPRRAPTQAKVCDILDQLDDLRSGGLPPVAMVVSAWDTVGQALSPDDWLAWRLPLVFQWAQANWDRVAFSAFAVSAQGGVLDGPARQELSAISGVERAGGPEALLAPVRWLLTQQ